LREESEESENCFSRDVENAGSSIDRWGDYLRAWVKSLLLVGKGESPERKVLERAKIVEQSRAKFNSAGNKLQLVFDDAAITGGE